METRNLTHHRKSAFSLIEFLLATALLASITAMLGVILFQSNKSKQVNEKELNRRQQLRLVQSIMEHDFDSIIFLPYYAFYKNQTGILGLNFEQEQRDVDQIHIHVHQDSLNSKINYKNDPKIHEVAYYLRRDPDNLEYFILYRRERFYIRKEFERINNIYEVDQAAIDDMYHVAIVYNRVISIDFKYIQKNNPSEYAEDWNSVAQTGYDNLPLAIVTTIKLADDNDQIQELSFQTNLRPVITNSNWDF